MNTPDFFKPEITRDDLIAKVHVVAWDKNGVEVPLALGCRLSGHTHADDQMIETMRQAAWQSVWMTAQTDSTNNANSLFTPQPEEMPIFDEATAQNICPVHNMSFIASCALCDAEPDSQP
jgi:hypothetical protein